MTGVIYVASAGRLRWGATLNALFALGFLILVWPVALSLWQAIVPIDVTPPVVDFMSGYSPPERNGYWMFLTLLFAGYLLLPTLLVPISGASPGKWLAGVRYVTASGARVGFGAAPKRAFVTLCLLAMIFLPGPILGFLFGPAADAYSLAPLGLGLLAAAAIGNARAADERELAYRIAGIWPVHRAYMPGNS